LVLFGDFAFKVGGEITFSTGPLCGGSWSDCAEDTFRRGQYAGTTLALIDDRMATAAVEIAPFICHECALDTLFQGYALHCIPPWGYWVRAGRPATGV